MSSSLEVYSNGHYPSAEVIKVYDGEVAWLRRIYRGVVVGRNWGERELVSAALRAFHVARDPEQFELTDALAGDEPVLRDPCPLAHVTRIPNKRPALFLRFKLVSLSVKGFSS